jgi:glyoxylase-like metal-dependent hydrolase (beta-lactamase superfamily II)
MDIPMTRTKKPPRKSSGDSRIFTGGATMSGITTNDGSLKWNVFTSKRPGLSRDLPPGKETLMWISNSSTLIYGNRDAVLVDTLLTIDQSQALLNWVIGSGKNLAAIYLTHAHGDHIFGLGSLLERFPHARAVASPEVVEAMRHEVSPASLENFWRKLFPDQIPENLPIADPLKDNELELDGYKMVAVNTGKTDTAQSTCLHVPSIGLLVGGDTVYNGIHPYLAETTRESRRGWITTLDKLETLSPRAVIAGHKIPENKDDPCIIAETRQYLRDFNRLDEVTNTARELYDAMLEIYPERANPGSLWGGAKAAKKHVSQEML